jgi:hypothetical protein
MTILALQKNSIEKTLIVALLISVVFAIFLFGTQRAHAQSASLLDNGPTAPNIDFGNHFPFGYGGGPRVSIPPIPPRVNDLLRNLPGRILDQINSIFDRVFGN